jgi:hypothetical protein
LKLLSILILVILSCRTYGQDLPTIGEIFDFKVGDEFHYKANISYSIPPHAQRLKIIGRIDDTTKNAIKYVRAWDNYSSTFEPLPEPHLIYRSKQYIDTLVVELIDSTIDWYIFPDRLSSILEDSSFHIDVSFGYYDDLCHSSTYTFQWTYSNMPGYGDYYEQLFAGGLGRISSYVIYEGTFAEQGVKMVYYYKGDSTCGIPDTTIVTKLTTLSQNKSISISPNPCSDYISIMSLNPDLESRIRIIDLSGKLIIQSVVRSTNNIDVHGLKSGIYLLQVIQSKNVYTAKFQKQ